MQEYQPKPNKGNIFKNKRKTSDKHPDYNGSICIAVPVTGELITFDIGLYINEDKNKNKYFAVTVTPKREYSTASAAPPQVVSKNTEEDLPF